MLIEPRGSLVAAEVGAATPVDRDGIAVDSQVEVLSSRSLAEKVVDKLAGIVTSLPASVRAAEVERLLASLEVARQGKTRVIAVRVRDTDPERAARIANLLVDTWLVEQLAGKYAAVNRAAEWFGDKLRALGSELAEGEARLVAFRERNARLFDTALARVEDRLADLEREHLMARAARRALEARLELLTKRAREDNLSTAALGAVTPLLLALEAAATDLLRREAELRGLYGEKHPQVAALLREKEELAKRIDAERRAILARVEAELAEARTREAALAAELQRIAAVAAEARRAELEKRRLEREVDLDRRLYEAFASKFRVASDVETVEQPDAQVISEATPPATPFFPKPVIVLPVGLVTGFGLGLVSLFLREKLDRRLTTTADVARELGLPTLALVPELPRRQAKALPPHHHIVEHPRSRLSESLRELLARLGDPPMEGSGRVILIVSAMPGEGKSTTTLALGRVAALEGLRVLVIDADLRRPGLADMLEIATAGGFAEVLEGRLALEEAVQLDEATGMHLLPGSARHLHPARLLARHRLRPLFDRLRSTYDLVLLDGAPVAAVADSQLLAREVDQLIWLVRWRHMPAPVVRDALDSLGAVRERVAGVVLSRVDSPVQARYGDAGSARLARRVAAYYTD